MLALVIAFFVLLLLFIWFIAAKWFSEIRSQASRAGVTLDGRRCGLLLAGFLLVRSSSAPA